MHGPGLCHSRQGQRIAGCNLKAREHAWARPLPQHARKRIAGCTHMGFEPTQFALVEPESVSTAGMTKTVLKESDIVHENKYGLPGSARGVDRSQRTLGEKRFCGREVSTSAGRELAQRRIRRTKARAPCSRIQCLGVPKEAGKKRLLAAMGADACRPRCPRDAAPSLASGSEAPPDRH